MYSLLIVDDERWVRQGLRNSIDWQSEGIEVVGDAVDGEEALTMLEELKPDIMITDIRMPGLSGLELLERIKVLKLHTRVIMISGYSDFSYAHKALKYGASDYVLKPIEEPLLLDSVRKCVDSLKHEHENSSRIKQMTGCIRESLPLARQHYLEKLLAGDQTACRDMPTKWEALGIVLNPAAVKVISVQVHHWGKERRTEKDRKLLRYALSNIAQEMGQSTGKLQSCPMDDRNGLDVVVLYSPATMAMQDDGTLLSRFLYSLIEAASKYLGIGINIGVSRERDSLCVPESLQEAMNAEAYAFHSGYGHVYDAAILPQSGRSSPGRFYKGPSGWRIRLIHAMKVGQDHLLQELVSELINHTQESVGTWPPHQIRQGLTHLLNDVAQELKENNCPPTVLPALPNLDIPLCSLEQLHKELLQLLLAFKEAYSGHNNRKRSIELALTYLDTHFADNITMNTVAEHLYLNPSYFSKLFHEEMNITFSKYLQNLRVEKAKHLLKDSHSKIYEIAEQVGYNNFRHFVKMFKEQEGITPVQYRNLGI